MKFVIDKNILLEALTNVSRAIGIRTTIPILNGIKFELTKEGLSLLASDSELTIKVNIEEKDIKKIDQEGKVIIQSKYILDIIRKMPSDVINFEALDENRIRIFTDSNEFNLNCYDINDYPHVKLEESKDKIVLKANVLKDIINRTVFAVSTQELRPLLTGINLKITGNILESIATDSYRVSKKTLELEENISNPINIVIPGRNILELEKILNDEENVDIFIFNNKILFKYKNIEFQTNLLSGTYPSINHLIPTEFNYQINLSLKAFNDAIDRASLITLSKNKNRVKLDISEKYMVISSSASEIGKTEEKIKIECSNKEKLEIGFNPKHLLDALKVIKDDNILLFINDFNKPIVIKSLEDESLIELVLPTILS